MSVDTTSEPLVDWVEEWLRSLDAQADETLFMSPARRALARMQQAWAERYAPWLLTPWL